MVAGTVNRARAAALNHNPETGETLCIGCNLCAAVLPGEPEIVWGWASADDATRRKVLTNFSVRKKKKKKTRGACSADSAEVHGPVEIALEPGNPQEKF